MAELPDRTPGASAHRDAADGAGGAIGHRFDQDALSLAEQSAGIGVWSIDLDSGLVRATAQFFRIMGLEPTDEPVPVERIRALRHPDDGERVLAGFRKVLDGGMDAYEMEYRIRRPDGQERWIFGRGRVVRNETGKPTRFNGVDLDITDRKAVEAALAAAKHALERMNRELEQRVRERTAELEAEAQRRIEAEGQLHQAQKMEAVGQLTGGIAHDFNNLLQVILGHLQIATIVMHHGESVSPGMDPQEVLRAAIATSQKAAGNASQLVKRLLAFSRLQTLEPTVLHVNALIEGLADMIVRTLGEAITVEMQLSADVWPTYADGNQLESALLNLVVNARDAMPQGGRLLVQTMNVESVGERPEEVPPGQHVLVAVSDNGCGIAPELLDKVFEPFFTTKDTGKGSGLGLSTVYGFVKQSGGHVHVSSEVGSGSIVRIYLPRHSQEGEQPSLPRPPSSSVEELPRAWPGETVLLVEDHEDVRRFGASALEGLGYRVIQAADGPSALSMLDDAGTVALDLLFTDIVLPRGVSGLLLAEALAEKQPGLPVLYTSGHMRNITPPQPDPDLRVLGKPYSLERLATSVREAIDRGKSRRNDPVS
jgi:PAS domain S-box-containing protein